MSAFDISFVIPCYNAGTFLREAVASIHRQHGPFTVADIVVVDDRSGDPTTQEVLREIRSLPAVRVIANVGPRGAASARNTGLAHATGNWIAFFDADDVLLPDSLAIRCETASRFPDCKWISADYQVLREDGTVESETFYGSRPLPRRYFSEALATGQPMRLSRPVAAFVDCCLSKIGANLIHRDLIDAAGLFDPELFMAEDHQYYIRLASVSDMIFVPRPVLLYRRHGTNTTNADVPPGLWPMRSLRQLLSKYGMHDHRAVIRRKLSYYHLANAYHFRKKRSVSAAAAESLAAIACAPASGEAWSCLAGSLFAR